MAFFLYLEAVSEAMGEGSAKYVLMVIGVCRIRDVED
jgi:hypothetical protein